MQGALQTHASGVFLAGGYGGGGLMYAGIGEGAPEKDPADPRSTTVRTERRCEIIAWSLPTERSK